jgi:hypothetical protein
MIDTKVEKEVGQVKEEFHAKMVTANKRIEGLVNIINKAKDGLFNEVNELRDGLKSVKHDLTNASVHVDVVHDKNRVVIKMLEEKCDETENPEITKNSVVSLFRDGLHLNDISVISAERKKANGRPPGVVIATVETNEQKHKIVKNKSKLRNSRNYSHVYIENETTIESRNMEANMRTILKEIGRDNDYMVRNGKIRRKMNSRDQRDESNRDADAWQTISNDRHASNTHRGCSKGGRR